MPQITVEKQGENILISQNYPFETIIIDCIDQIPQDTWHEIFGEDKIESYHYQKVLEKSKLSDFSIKYLLVKRSNSISSIVPFFIMDFSLFELLPESINKIPLPTTIKNIFKMKMLFIGTPTIESSHIGISKGENIPVILDTIIDKLIQFSKEQKIITILFNNLNDKDKAIMAHLAKKNFLVMESLPNSVININFESMGEYINSLSSSMRKDLRRKFKKSHSLTSLRTELREDVSSILPEIYNLYLNNLTSGQVQFETLTLDFFKNICIEMKDTAKFFLTYENDKLIAFNLCFIKGDYCIDKFIGFDKELAHKYHLYFTTIYHNLNWCIENGIKSYETGTTDYHPKVRLGAKLIPLYIYAKAINPFLHFIMKKISKYIQPKNMDPSLKEIAGRENN